MAAKQGKTIIRGLLVISFIVVFNQLSFSQTSVTFNTGSYIVNMGIVPQTIANGLKPYGLVYDLIKNYDVPVYWVIGDSKLKDGVDFNYNGVDYKGGTFVIPKDFITTAVAGRISFFGVTGTYTTSNLTLTPDYKLTSVPSWTLDAQNGGIATGFYVNAGIPSTSYNWLAPSLLGVCNDVFVMPHADPKWATHGNLYNWNLTYKGSIWLGCHAGSALENMYNPDDISQQTNFLTNKVTTPGTGIILPVPGSTNYAQNSLVLWGNHAAATIPYNTLTGTVASGTIPTPSDPVAQYMGVTDLAHLNGSEQVYLPVLGGSYRSSTKIICYDPSQANVPLISPGPAVIIAYGRGFGKEARGYVMVEAGHSINKGSAGDVPAQRAFFNWSYLATIDKVPVISSITGILPTYAAQPYPKNYPLTVNYSSPVSSPFVKFTWTCRNAVTGATVGSFLPNGTSGAASTQFTPPNTLVDIPALISVRIEDECGRSTVETFTMTIGACSVTASGVATSPNCFGGTGSVAVTVNGGTGPYNYTYTGAASGSGSSATSPFTVSGLAAGTYDFTVSDASGCSASFSALINQPNLLVASATKTDVLCYGESNGSVDLTITGGTPPYTYLWSNSATTQDLLGVPAGTYTVNVTDAKSCTAIASATVGQPVAGIVVSGNVTNINCYGNSTGAIDITASGGTGPYTYNWGGGITTEDRSLLAAGSYSVIVTDASGCTATQSFTVTQPANLVLSTSVTQPTCRPNPPAVPPTEPKNSDGAIDLTVTGGTSPYTYLWTASNDGVVPAGQATSQDLTGLVAGTYSVTVTDNKGCIKSTSVVLNFLNPNPVQPSNITK